jgi:TonB family protein
MESEFTDPDQEQSMASRDPTGFGKAAAAQPLVQALQGSSSPRPQALAAPSELTSPPAPHSSKPPPLVLIDPKAPANLAPAESPLSAGPLAAKPAPPPQPQQQQPQQPSPSNSPTQAPQNPSEANPGGKPIPQEDYESVPVTTIASRFVGGEIDARTGRRHRLVPLPDITLAGYIDLEGMERSFVGLRLKIDKYGNVTDVRIAHSSGSDSLDLPCQRAAASWWFEPRKDPVTGKPVPDVIDFAIVFK